MYILECVDGSYYTGSTWDLSRRISEHETGEGARYTSQRLPIRLVYSEEFDRIDEAFAREKQVQNWSHAKKVALIAGKSSELKEKAKKIFKKGKNEV